MKSDQRLFYIDLMKGVIMILMALDHARAFISKNHPSEFWAVSMPDYQGDGFAFLTRLITHICAPGFFFVMGVSMVLYQHKHQVANRSTWLLYKFFSLRGLMLILLQLTVVNIAWLFGSLSATGTKESYGTAVIQGNSGELWIYFGVLSALGCALLVTSWLLRLPNALVLLLSLTSIAASILILPGNDQVTVGYPEWLRVLAIPGQTDYLAVRYSLLPWLSLTLLGVFYGRSTLNNRIKTNRIGFIIGLCCVAAFFVLRYRGGFGNIHPPASLHWIDFFNVTKYPPSLCFLLLTMGVNLILLTLLSFLKPDIRPAKWCATFGQATLFFYIVHLYIYGALGYLFPEGISLRAMYSVWILGLILLYPLCLGFLKFKTYNSKNSLIRNF